MLFNTFAFWLLFFIACGINFSLPMAWRKWFLLGASYGFYMSWSPGYVVVILAITGLDYLAGRAIEQSIGRARRFYLILSIGGNFGLLFVFKYARFAVEALHLTGVIHAPQWVVPVGLSFHTFQAVSYTMDVYRGRFPAERNIGAYALYVAFFPQMIAGPIERPGNLIPQLRQPQPFGRERLGSGLALALWGLIKKSVVADLAATAVASVYDHPASYSSGMLWLATGLFSVQVYCDFSGYSDIALGTARILGYDLTENFRQPYSANSITDFWRRWHISLSTWFRDYLYVPTGGNRQSIMRWSFSVLAVFMVSGLWHGANATFVAWGLLHAGYMLAGRAMRPIGKRISMVMGNNRLKLVRAALSIVFTNLLVTVAWVFFRAHSLEAAFEILSRMCRPAVLTSSDLFGAGLPRFEMALLLVAAPLVFVCEWLYNSPTERFGRIWQRPVFRWPVYAAGVYSLVFFGVFGRTQFIYFRF